MKEKTFRPRKDLTLAAIAVLMIVLVVEFCLRDMPPFIGWKHASRMATFVVNLGSAFVASYIFHVVGELWNYREDRKKTQVSIETSILGLFDAFRLLGEGMYKQMNIQKTKPFHFEIGDDLLLSYDWDKMLASGDEVDRELAVRMLDEVDQAFQMHLMELDDEKENLQATIRIRLKAIASSFDRVRQSIGSQRISGASPSALEGHVHMNYIGDRINDLHARLHFFKRWLRAEWPCINPDLKAFLHS